MNLDTMKTKLEALLAWRRPWGMVLLFAFAATILVLADDALKSVNDFITTIIALIIVTLVVLMVAKFTKRHGARKRRNPGEEPRGPGTY